MCLNQKMIELESELEELNLIIGYRRSKIIGYSLPKKRSVVLTDKTHAENNGFDQAELMRLFWLSF